MTERPPTRWAEGGVANAGYGRAFGEMAAAEQDMHGEARLADALLPRGSRVLDAGSGMGRVGAELLRRGHQVVAVELDAALVAQSRSTYPGLPVVECDLTELTPQRLAAEALPTAYDLVVAVGNVMVFLARDSERPVLRNLRDLLAPSGRILVGYHLRGAPASARAYPVAEFVADAASAGLRVDLRAGSYELHPPGDEYTVLVLAAQNGSISSSSQVS